MISILPWMADQKLTEFHVYTETQGYYTGLPSDPEKKFIIDS